MWKFRLIAFGLLIAFPHKAVAQNELHTSGIVVRDAGDPNGLSMLQPEKLSEDLSAYVRVARPVIVLPMVQMIYASWINWSN